MFYLLGGLIALLAVYLCEKLHYRRVREYNDWPQAPTSLLFGHLKVIHDFSLRGDRRRHLDTVLSEIRESIGNPAAFFLDLRPLHPPLAVICNHEVAEQITKSSKKFPYGLDKSPSLGPYKPLLGDNSIIVSAGKEWKHLRQRYSPGFAPKHLMSMLPCVVDEAWKFVGHLDAYAKSGQPFRLDRLCVNLTFDIIGAVAMDLKLGSQLEEKHQSPLVDTYRQLIGTYRCEDNMNSLWFRPWATVRRWGLTRRLNRLIKMEIRRQFDHRQQTEKSGRPRSAISIALEGVERLDSHTLDQACDQLKGFLFAGHDTTSVLLQWSFYELSRTPHALKALRRELEELFGKDVSSEALKRALATQGEVYLPKMVYTSAVIKEILRLYPPSGSATYSPPGTGFYLDLPNGPRVCMDGMVGYNCVYMIQRDESVFGANKDHFWPERWLDANTNEAPALNSSAIPPSAYRPFERGPRNCIGQELANIEARVILACTMMRYDFEKVGLGKVARDPLGNRLLDAKGQYMVECEVFNVSQITAVPVDGMMGRVRFSDSHR